MITTVFIGRVPSLNRIVRLLGLSCSLWFLWSCDEPAAPGANTLALPAPIARFQPNNPDGTMSAYIRVDGGSRQTMAISAGQATLSLFGLTRTSHTFTIEFEYNSSFYGVVMLATGTKPATLGAGSNTVDFSDIGYAFPDDDNNGTSNLVELEQGSDPKREPTLVYVSVDDPNADDINNPGTQALPFASIDAAIGKLIGDAVDYGEVRVAAGTYNVAPSPNDHLVLVEGISVFGGYSLDWTQRQPDVTQSILVDSSSIGGVVDNPNRVVFAAAGISRRTIFDGFVVNGGGGDRSAAIFINSGSPTVRRVSVDGGPANFASRGITVINSANPVIRDSTINGGSAPNAIGIVNKNSSTPLIDNNHIQGGGVRQSGSVSRGIFNNVAAAATVVRNNVIRAGLGEESIGVFDFQTSSHIYNNVIFGSDKTTAAAPESGFGIRISGSGISKIENNSLFTETGSVNTGVAIEILDTATPSVINNILFNFPECMREGGPSEDPVAIKNNDFFNCTVYVDEGATNLTLGEMQLLNPTPYTGNVQVHPAVDTGFELQLGAGSPVAVTQGGLTLSGFDKDRNGTKRTAPWSMGAYESP